MPDRLPIAIIGAACRLPGAPTLADFADLLFSGREAIADVPAARWTSARYLHPTPGQPGKTYSFRAGSLPDVDRFDAAFFGISPREAVRVDPHQRLMLELAYEAIEDAGQPLRRLSGCDVGVYIGGSSWDFAARSFSDAAGLDAYSMQGAALSSLANRISYVFNLRGPSFTVDTACSSSLVALHLACAAMRRGEIGTALVGGVNLLLAPQSFVGFARASMLSRLGRCHAFDARADGYVRAEGGGAILLKPLGQAIADGDDVRGVIRATGMNSDGRTNGFSLPNGEAQAALLRRVYEQAEVEPDALDYFEAHGTGTPVGDPIEAYAIGTALAQRRSRPLPIGSVKTNVGHLEPASGMAGLMKLLLAFEHRAVPRSLHFETPNPNIDFDALNLEVVGQRRKLATCERGFLAGINSFGFGGTNATAILASHPCRVAPPESVPVPLLASARSPAALRALAADWRDRLAHDPHETLPSLLRGAARRREHHAHRLAVSGTPDEIAARLDTFLADGRAAGVATAEARPGDLAFVFSGNGSQWAGMARDALAFSPAFAAGLAEVDALLLPELGWSVAARLADEDLSSCLRDTAVAQPLLFAVQVASVAALRAQGVLAAAHVGHSAGEVAAAWASGALTLAQACHVIIQRSDAQQATHGAGSMAAAGLSADDAEALIAEHGLDLAIAANNGIAAVTVAGPVEDLDYLGRIAATEGWAYTKLDLDYAFHSPAMAPIRGPLRAALGTIASAAPQSTLVSTVTGKPVAAGELDAEYWWRNVRAPVAFRPALDYLVGQGVRILVEVGPAPVLQPFLREALVRAGKPGHALTTLTRAPAASDPFAAAALNAHVAGADLSGAAAFDGHATARGLPLYSWQRQVYRAEPTVEAVELAEPVCDHRLLGFRDPQVPGQWMSHLSLASEPWLADHALDGTVVLPAAAMIDMALAAARVQHPGAASLELQDLEITRALVLEPGAVRDCRTSLTADGQLTLASRPRLADEAPLVHATCRALPGTALTPILPMLAGIPVLAGILGEAVAAETVYATADALRLHYGPQFRTVAGVTKLSPTQCVAELTPRAPDRTAERYVIDPALLDGCLQALLVLAAGRAHLAHGLVVPWRFGRVRLLRPSGAVPARAVVSVRHIGPRSICADFALLDDAGDVVAELLECWFAAVPKAAAAPANRMFWTAHVPSARQVLLPAADLLRRVQTAVEPAEDTHASVLLADAYAAAAAFEALRPQTRDGSDVLPETVIDSVLAETALGWLAEEGSAVRTPAGWSLATETDLPPAGEIWRSLFYDVLPAGAECALLAGIGPALSGAPEAIALSAALREQILFASPAATCGADAVLRAMETLASHWPEGRCMRLAAIGALHRPLLRRVTERLAVRAVPLRLVLLARDADSLAGLQDLLAQTPGAEARSWEAFEDTVSEQDRHGFDVVLNLYGLSLPVEIRATPAMLSGLVAPGGLLLDVEPVPSRVAQLVFNAPLKTPDAWCAALADAGLITARPTALGGALWPVALLAATRPAEPANVCSETNATDLVVFAAPDDPVAQALATREGFLRLLPIEAMKDALGAPYAASVRHLLLIAPGAAEEDAAESLPELLAEISAALLRLPGHEAARLWLVAHGSPVRCGVPAALAGLRRVAANELPGLDCRTLTIDAGLPPADVAERILIELAAPDDEREVYWTQGGRLVPRLRRHAPPAPPSAGPRRLEVTHPGLIASLAWQTLTPRAPGPLEVAIDVRAAALNFRDVMWAQGLLPDEALLDGFSGPSLGLECAGVVTAVGDGVTDLHPGDRVMAVSPAALATHAVTARNGVIKLPPGLNFAAAATIPVAFMTAVYALGHLARLAPGERVLIHGGAGAVGLAAIQYALHRGAVVYTTAGSAMRRQTLRMLGVAGAFDSRSTGFVDDVLRATGGAGVDVILNSLSGELMQQTVRLLRPFGRFLEIGKRDLYRNTPMGIRPLRHNASYFAIDSDELVAHRPAIGQAVLDEIATLLAAGQLQPLPYRAYGFADAVEAFRLLQSSGHVGKVVLLAEPTQTVTRARFTARPDAVYVVTGGLTGFGLEAARWLARNGATRLILLSRRGAATPGADAALAGLRLAGAHAKAIACDVADEPSLARVLARVRKTAGPIAGVIHAAMVIDDALLPELDAARFAAVIRPKLAGAIALDRATAADPLDLFVLFSSISTALGTPGQANYVAANAAVEALAAARHARGLPALAVQWGPIGDAGYLTREQRVSDMLAAMLGAQHLRAAAALDALPALLATGRPVMGLADVAWADLRSRLPGLSGPLWSEMPTSQRGDAASQSLRTRLASLTDAEAADAVLDILVEEIAAILQQSPAAIDINRPVGEFGVDSLMAVELRTALEQRLGADLPLLSLGATTTLRALSLRLLQTLRNATPAPEGDLADAILRHEGETADAVAGK